MCKYALTFMLICSSYVIAEENSLQDPTRPIGGGGVGTQEQQSVQLVLNSILISQSRQLAIINGQTMSLGQKLKGTEYKLVAIHQQSVTLSGGGQTRMLKLLKTGIKK